MTLYKAGSVEVGGLGGLRKPALKFIPSIGINQGLGPIGGSGSSLPSWLFNYNPSYFSRFKTATSTKRARFMCAGDSKTIGFSSGPGGSNSDEQANSYPTQLAGLLGPSIANQNSVFGWGVGTGVGGGDSRLTLNNWATTGGSNLSLGANPFFVSEDTTSLIFAPPGNIDTCDLWLITNPANGSYTYAVDGGSASAPVSTNASANIHKRTISLGASSTHSIALNQFSGGIFHLGFECYDSTKPNNISILNCGSAGTTSANQIDSSHGYAPLATIVTFAPDGAAYDIGTNDMATSVPTSTIQTNIQAWLNNILPSTDVILAVTAPVASSVAPLSAQSDYRTMIRALAVSNNLICVDLMSYFGSWIQANANGYFANSTHPNALGYGQIASVYQYVLNKILAS